MTPEHRTARIKQQVREYLDAHLDAPLYEVVRVFYRPEYASAVAKFIGVVQEAINEAELLCKYCHRPKHRLGDVCPVHRMQVVADNA